QIALGIKIEDQKEIQITSNGRICSTIDIKQHPGVKSQITHKSLPIKAKNIMETQYHLTLLLDNTDTTVGLKEFTSVSQESLHSQHPSITPAPYSTTITSEDTATFNCNDEPESSALPVILGLSVVTMIVSNIFWGMYVAYLKKKDIVKDNFDKVKLRFSGKSKKAKRRASTHIYDTIDELG
ncbi:unnamed protein product, partial [Meganyctiphanes norvegica]